MADPLNSAAMALALRGPPQSAEPQANPMPAPQRQPTDLEAALKQANDFRKTLQALPVGLQRLRGGGMITLKGTF